MRPRRLVWMGLLGLATVLAGVAGAQQAPAARGDGEAATYVPAGRRDPFVSLLGTGGDPRDAGPRPPGVAGLMVTEVALKGVLQSTEGFAALLQGPDMKTYSVRVGDVLMDGRVRFIGRDEIVFLQRVVDPAAPTREVEVRRRLRQVGEGQ